MYIGAIIGAIIGGALGLLGFFISNKIVKDKKKAQTIFIIIFAGVMGGLMPLLNSPQFQMKIMPFLSKDHALQIELHKKVIAHVNNPEYRAESEDMSLKTAQQFTQKGLARLSNDQLVIWNAARLNMANKSPALCSALWDGDFSNVNFTEVMRSLEEHELEDWIKVSAASLEAELAETSPNPPDNELLQATIESFNNNLSEDDKQRAQLTFAKGAGANKDDGCWLMRSIMTYAEENQSDGIQISRWLATISAQSAK